MKVSEEMLMAYVDRELDRAGADAVEQAMRDDPRVAGAVARARALREQVRAAYAPTVREPVPQRLLDAARGGGTAGVASDPPRRARRPARPLRWREWTALAASLACGFFLATWVNPPGEPAVELVGGQLRAGGGLARALDRGLAPATAGPIVPGLSFRAKDGRYCRTFTLRGPAGRDAKEDLAGLACREATQWQVQVLAEAAGTGAGSPLRLAASPLPPAVLVEVDERIDGEPLDAAGERRARDAGWR